MKELREALLDEPFLVKLYDFFVKVLYVITTTSYYQIKHSSVLLYWYYTILRDMYIEL